MSILLRSRSGSAFGIMLLIVLCSGCVVSGEGYSGRGGVVVSYGVDFYEPYGYYYGGWGPGYLVGPPRGGYPHPDHRPNRPRPHAYRPAPPSHPMPSIPTRQRPGAARPR
jgi:hypothetical protein